MDVPSVFLTAKGLVTQPNELAAEPGSMKVANNVIIKRENVIEQRRGFKLYGDALGSVSDRTNTLFQYRNRIIRHYSDVLQFDTETNNNENESIFNSFAGSYEEVSPGLRIKSVESNGNLYFTTNEGVKKISAKNADQFSSDVGYIVNAGGIKATNITAVLDFVLETSGFLPADSSVAYRVVWSKRDVNNNVLPGTPSNRSVVYNSLQESLIKDTNNLLSILDNIQYDVGSQITDGNYLESLGLTSGASAEEIQTNLVSLAEKLDTDPGVLFNTAQISSASISGGVCTVTLSNNIGIYGKVAIGDKLYLKNFIVTGTGSINGVQTVDSVDGGTTNTITFLTSATGTVSTSVASIESGWFRSISQPAIPSSPATHTQLTELETYLQSIITELRSDNNVLEVAKNDGNSTINPQEIDVVTIPGSGTLSVSFLSGDTFDSFENGQYAELAGSWTFSGTPNPSLVYPVTIVNTTNTTFAIEASSSNPVTINNTSQIFRVFRFSNRTKNNWFLDLETTASANTLVYIDVPFGATTNTFFQIYRSDVIEAELTDNVFDLIPSDDMRLVYEAFPTEQEIASGEIVVKDIVTDAFFQGGAFLYTNENGGDGILQSNDAPPLAYDINRFRNVIFYANTRIKHILQESLLGVANIIQDFDDGRNPEYSISSEESYFSYKFVKGVEQVIQITAPPGNTITNGNEFVLNTPDNVSYTFQFFPAGSVATQTGDGNFIGIPFNSSLTNIQMAELIAQKINVFSDAFNAQVSGALVNVTNVNPGPSTYTAGSISITTTTQGQGERLSKQQTVVQLIAGNAFDNTGIAEFFTLSTAFDKNNYYFWYNVDGDNTDPQYGGGITGQQIAISSSDSASQVAQKTKTAVEATGLFTVEISGSQITIVDKKFGPSTGANSFVADTGFTINVTAGALDILLSNSISPSLAVEETTLSLINVINKNEDEIVSAFYLSGSNDTPGKFLLEAKTVEDIPFYALANTTATGNSFNSPIGPAGSITSIASDGVFTTITAPNHGLNNGEKAVLMLTNSYPTINGVFEVSNTTTNTFQIFKPIKTAGTTGVYQKAAQAEVSDNDRKPNRLYYSKISQPEAVPILNYVDIGAEEKAILRIFPLRNSLFIFKEDGLYRLSGASAPWDIQLFDSTCVMNAPDSIGVVNNFLCLWTTKGISSVSEVGVEILSRKIDIEILKLATNNYKNFSTATWGLGYESDNSYLVFTVSEENDDVATQAYRYDTLTNSWTKYTKTNTCGLVKTTDDKLYLGAGDTNYLEQERKNYSRLDYADRDYTYQLQENNYNVNAKTLKISEAVNIFDFNAGDVLTQEQLISIYDFDFLNEKLDFDPVVSTIYNIQNITFDGVNRTAEILLDSSPQDYILPGNKVQVTDVNPIGFNGIFTVNSVSASTITVSDFTSNPGTYLNNGGKLTLNYKSTFALNPGDNLRTEITAIANKLSINPFIDLGDAYQRDVSQYGFVGASVSSITPGLVSLPTYGFLPANVNTSTNIITATSSSYVNGDLVTFASTGTLPSGLTTSQQYYIVNASGNTFQVALLANGTPIALGTQGVGSHTVKTSHGLKTGRYISITNSTCTPTINNRYFVTEIDENRFSIPVSISAPGTLDYETLTNSFEDIKACYNIIVRNLNLDNEVAFSNYKEISNNTLLEAIITNVDKVTRTFTVNLGLQFVVGPITIYKAINSEFEYLPFSLQSPAMMNQFREAQVMYIDKTFTTAALSFATDLFPEFVPVPVTGMGSGLYGNTTNGEGFYGGEANSPPFRTYVPRNCARSRYLRLKYQHNVAREQYGVLGMSVTGRPVSAKAYR